MFRIQKRVGPLGKGGELLDVDQHFFFIRQRLVLARNGLEGAYLRELKLQEIGFFRARPAHLLDPRDPAAKLAEAPVGVFIDGPRVQAPAEFIENVDVVVRREDQLMLVLAADVDQRFADLRQMGERRHLAVDLGPVFAAAGNHPPDDEFLACGKSQPGKFFLQTGIVPDRKERFHGGGVGLRPNHVRRSPVAQKQAHRADQNGLARSGFARNDVEALFKRNVQFVDDGKVGNTELIKHFFFSRFLTVNCPNPV